MDRIVALLTLCLLLLATPSLPAAAQEDDAGQVYRRGMELYRSARYGEALPFFERALDQAQARYGVDSPMLALDLNNLAEVHRQLGRHKEAERLYKRAIDLDERGGGGDDGEGLATSLNNLAMLYRTQGRLKEAEPLYKRSLATLEKALGPSHPDVAKGLNNLAVLYRMQGAGEKARPLQERALATAEKALGPDHPTTKALRRNLDQVMAPPTPIPAPVTAPPPPGTARPSARTTTANAAAKAAAPAAKTAAPRIAAVATVPPPTPAPSAPPAEAAGRFAVQLASLKDPGAVPAEWRRLAGRHPALRGAQPSSPPRPVEVLGKGVFYRVAGGAFASRAEAQAACEQVRAAGQYCVVVPPL